MSDEHREEYYFYLVRFGKEMTPVELIPIKAAKLYELCEKQTATYEIQFNL